VGPGLGTPTLPLLAFMHSSAWRDCPKRGTSNAPKVDWDAMRKSKWVEKSLLDDL
jgi:hypothetical protein